MQTPVLGFSAFLEGLQAPLTGFEFMGRNPKLWRYGILPVAVNLLLTGLVLLGLIGAGAYFTTVVHPKFSPGFMGWIGEILLIVCLFVLACSLAFAFWMIAQIAACGYFYGKLARQVEKLLGMKDEEIVEIPLLHEITDTLWESLSLLLLNLLFLLIQFVPVVGAVVGVSGSYYFTSLALGREYWDYPLALRGLRRKEKHRFARQHQLHTLGLGTAVMILFLLPIVNAVLLTTAVTGAVLLHRKILASSPDGPAIRDCS
ncbi:MAG: EI24 domain-containing protein [Pirellulales bacterium]|nr:EI24 domain-containing protein [Pirellulales bacterium]